MDSKKTLSIIAIIAILLAGFFALKPSGPSEEELKKIADLEAALEEQEQQSAKEANRIVALEEARRLAEEATQKASEAEAVRLEELANQVERDRREKARLASLVDDLNAKTETISQQQKDLQEALAKARLERERAAVDAAAKLKAAETQLTQAEASKQMEIDAARAAALEEALERMKERADQGGYTAVTEIITERKKESINSFLSVQIQDRNFRNNTRRAAQRRGGE